MSIELSEDIDNITEWAELWRVTFNPKKSVNLTFTRWKTVNITPIHMNETQIEDVDHHKHLGCILQKNGKGTHRIKEVVTKSLKKIDILRSLRFRLDQRTLETLYTSYIRPSFEYANIVWINWIKTYKKL